MRIIKAKNYNDMSRISANIVSAQVILNKKSVLGLPTGETPIGMYKQLIEWNAQNDIDFNEVITFNLDEYVGLSKEDENSYASFMWNIFFKHINIDVKNVFIPDGITKSVEAECLNYEKKIEEAGGIDLQVLGIGHNGHIGFNEPNTCFKRSTHKAVLSESTINTNARFFNDNKNIPRSAITIGMGTIMRAEKILLLCTGQKKAEALYKTVFGDIDPMIPASILQLHSDVTIVADTDAMVHFEEGWQSYA